MDKAILIDTRKSYNNTIKSTLNPLNIDKMIKLKALKLNL